MKANAFRITLSISGIILLLVPSIAFPVNADDNAFYEELVPMVVAQPQTCSYAYLSQCCDYGVYKRCDAAKDCYINIIERFLDGCMSDPYRTCEKAKYGCKACDDQFCR